MNVFIFALKRIITWPMFPLGATLLFLLAETGTLLKGRKRSGTFCVLLATILLLIFSLNWTGFTLLNHLETEAGPFANPVTLRSLGVKYVLILGGEVIKYDRTAADRWDGSVLRLLEGIRLWREIPGAKLVISGPLGSSNDAIQELPIQLGVPREALIIETRAIDTSDEVELFKPIVGSEPFALVTAAFHMPRALYQFRSKGTYPMPCPCEFQTRRGDWTIWMLLPTVLGLERSQTALHEYYGRLFYWIKNGGMGATVTGPTIPNS